MTSSSEEAERTGSAAVLTPIDDIIHGQAGTEVYLHGGGDYDTCEDDNYDPVTCENVPVQTWSCPW